MIKETIEKLRAMASVKTSALYSQRSILNKAADLLEKAETEQRDIQNNLLPTYLSDKIEQVATEKYEWGTVPVYREKGNGMSRDTDTMSLLTKLVNELKDENEFLKRKNFELESQIPFKENYGGNSLAKQIGDIEAGKVGQR